MSWLNLSSIEDNNQILTINLFFDNQNYHLNFETTEPMGDGHYVYSAKFYNENDELVFQLDSIALMAEYDIYDKSIQSCPDKYIEIFQNKFLCK